MKTFLSVIGLMAALVIGARAEWLAWDDPNPASAQVGWYVVYQGPTNGPMNRLGTTTNKSWNIGVLPTTPVKWCVTAANSKGESAQACLEFIPLIPESTPMAVPEAVKDLKITGNLVTNGDFESAGTGWTVTPTVTFGTPWPGVKPFSGKSCAVFGDGNLPGGALTQLVNTVSGLTYTLQFRAAAAGAVVTPQRLSAAVIGKTTLATTTVTVSPGSSVTYTTSSLKFTADGPVAIQFRDVSATTISIDLLLDDVQVIQP